MKNSIGAKPGIGQVAPTGDGDQAFVRQPDETLDHFVNRMIEASIMGLNDAGFKIPEQRKEEDDFTFLQRLLASFSGIHEAKKPISYWSETLPKMAAGVEIALKDLLQTRSETDIAGMLVTLTAFISQVNRPDVEPNIKNFRYEHGRHFLLTCARLLEKRLPEIVKATDAWLEKRRGEVSSDEYAVLEQGWVLFKATIVTMDGKQLFPGTHDDLLEALTTEEFRKHLKKFSPPSDQI